MMPFSVLRTFSLAIFSWLVLGAGVYFAYHSYRSFTADPLVVQSSEVVDDTLTSDAIAANSNLQEDAVLQENAAPLDQPVDWRPWAMLATAVLCLGLSVGGKWPTEWILSNPQGKPRAKLEPHSTYQLDRPDGARLHVNVLGKTDGPTLIFTHGWTLNSSAWDYIISELASQFRIVTWDLPGLGKSRAPTRGDFSMEMLAQHLQAVVESNAAAGPAILVGHSIGGMTQQTFCRLFPQQLGHAVVAMALVHTTYTIPVRTNFAATLLTAIEKPVIVPMNYLMIALAPFAWLSNWQSYLNGSAHWTTRFTSFTGRQTREQLDHSARMGAIAWPATVARGNLAMLGFEARETLPEVRIPVLVVGGEKDPMTLCSASEHISQLLPNDQPLRIPGAHLGYWEYASDVTQALRDFASKQFAARTNDSPQNPVRSQSNSTIRIGADETH